MKYILALFLGLACSFVYAGCPGGKCNASKVKTESATVFIEPTTSVVSPVKTKTKIRNIRRIR